jgi:hypothetical protein
MLWIWICIRIRIRMDPHHFGKLDPDRNRIKVKRWKPEMVILKHWRVKIWEKVSGRIRIRIRISAKSRIRIRIRIKVKSRIRIRINVMRIRNTALCYSCSIDGKGNSMEGILGTHASKGY